MKITLIFFRLKATHVANILSERLTSSDLAEEEYDNDESDENENAAGKTEAKKLTRKEAVQELFLQVKHHLERSVLLPGI
jgi:hypothetical protein